MYFCPKCYYLFDIGKASGKDDDESKELIKKVADALKKVDEDLQNYKAEFKEEDLYKNAKYKKLNEEQKQNLSKLFEDKTVIGAEFKCNNCNFIKPIKDTVLLFQLEYTENLNKVKNLNENKLYCQNPILPRTHDYICKNTNCLTNKDKKTKKESVFYRNKNSFKMTYICCVCYHSW
jgi:hypothetical protein